jgi:hypothetical protein
MMPIVNGLEEQYRGEIVFIYAHAADSATGQAAFEQLSLPGHPSYVIFDANQVERFRTFGIVPDAQLIEGIRLVLG